MGRFIYGDTVNEAYRVDDRTLVHIEIAIGAQLRKGGAFAFTLDGEVVPAGRGRHVLWVHPAIPMQFRYQSERSGIRINPSWVADLAATAGSELGLRIIPEPSHTEARTPLYG
ncbi:MAG TPA: ATP-dependent DNA ligase [Microbacteriaceae bacterium]|nr:ATP-dependent DNA ligase [Microbacteriaceae bacterium]